MIIHDVEQLSEEWFALRRGKITGTSFRTMANGRKDGIETLCLKVASEILTGVSAEKPFTNDAMEEGVALEPLARQAYEARTFDKVDEVGFLELNEFIGCSPDGLVGEDGLVEIKCPMQHTHLKYLASGGKAWRGYKWQVQGALWVSGRKWLDFVSYNPYFPPHLQLYVERVLPDMVAFEKLNGGMDYCVAKIETLIGKVRNANVSE